MSYPDGSFRQRDVYYLPNQLLETAEWDHWFLAQHAEKALSAWFHKSSASWYPYAVGNRVWTLLGRSIGSVVTGGRRQMV
jgi:hypothetical protein